MFEWLPIFHGRYFTYQENIFVIATFVVPTLIITFGSIGMWLNRPKKKNSLRRSLNQSYAKPSILVEEDNNSDETVESTSAADVLCLSPQKKKMKALAGTRRGNACIWIAWFLISICPGVMATFRIVFPMWLAVPLGWIILGLRIRHKERKDKTILNQKLKKRDKLDMYEAEVKPVNHFYRKIKITAILLVFSLGAIFDGLCVSSFQDYVGPIFGTASLSSRLTRYFQLSKACPIGPACHIYASLPEDTATSVFINVHTHESYQTLMIEYDTVENYERDNDLQYSAKSVSLQLSGMENNGVRRVHSTLLNDLEPDTDYYFRIIYADDVQGSGYYRTLPDENSEKELVIVQGGDMGNTVAARKVVAQAALMKPDVVVIGGDMAYDNGQCTCYFVWDFFLNDMKQINDVSGRLVPVILAPGNHDMGIDPLPRRIRRIDTEGPFYMALFPQHYRTVNGSLTGARLPGVPRIEERRTYYYHKLGKTILFSLDSGYIADIQEQANEMSEVLSKHKEYIKFVQYHCPIYYACNDVKKFEKELTKAQFDAWIPVFDKHKVALVFENDEHQMKRSFPLRGNKTDPLGTLYIGNGEWGTDEGYECYSSNKTGLYEQGGIIHHYWVVNITKDQIYNTAYNKTNYPVIQTKSQNVSDYIMA